MSGGPQGHTCSLPSWPSAAPSHTRAMVSVLHTHRDHQPFSPVMQKRQIFAGVSQSACGSHQGKGRATAQPGQATQDVVKEPVTRHTAGEGCRLPNVILDPETSSGPSPDLFKLRQFRSSVSLTPFSHRHRKIISSLKQVRENCKVSARDRAIAQTRGVSVSPNLLPQISPPKSCIFKAMNTTDGCSAEQDLCSFSSPLVGQFLQKLQLLHHH